MKRIVTFFVLFLSVGAYLSAEKTLYIPGALGNVNNDANQWSLSRSRQSANFVVFWEAGYGDNPDGKKVEPNGKYTVDVNKVLALAEQSFDYYADTLKFIERGKSLTDNYKMIIRLRYTDEWEATGSGMDDKIGLLTLTAWSGSALGITVAHEVGHCFQYQVHCDGFQGGWMYGLGENGAGGNCFWEMCAQWMALRVLPQNKFSERLSEYYSNEHLNPMHESPRYANHFIQNYWTYKHGDDIIARLWQQSVSPEDPIETYKRLTGITQEEFNDEMYDLAARFVTWDIPELIDLGKTHVVDRGIPKLNAVEDGYFQIDTSKCIQNYGHNIIRLNPPAKATTIVACVDGLLGKATNDYRSVKAQYNGWRFGFVVHRPDGTRLYSPVHALHTSVASAIPKDTLYFECPAGGRVFFVISGAPTEHWQHAWDDNYSNDEQWGYRVKFYNTNVYGKTNNELDLALPSVAVAVATDDLYVRDIYGRTIYHGTDNNAWRRRVPTGIYLITQGGKTTKEWIQ